MCHLRQVKCEELAAELKKIRTKYDAKVRELDEIKEVQSAMRLRWPQYDTSVDRIPSRPSACQPVPSKHRSQLSRRPNQTCREESLCLSATRARSGTRRPRVAGRCLSPSWTSPRTHRALLGRHQLPRKNREKMGFHHHIMHANHFTETINHG